MDGSCRDTDSVGLPPPAAFALFVGLTMVVPLVLMDSEIRVDVFWDLLLLFKSTDPRPLLSLSMST